MPPRMISRGERMKLFFRTMKHKIKFFIVSRLPNEHIEWTIGIDGFCVPVCPRCGEYVYYKNQCVNCGQHFLPGAETIGGVLNARAETGAVAERGKL